MIKCSSRPAIWTPFARLIAALARPFEKLPELQPRPPQRRNRRSRASAATNSRDRGAVRPVPHFTNLSGGNPRDFSVFFARNATDLQSIRPED